MLGRSPSPPSREFRRSGDDGDYNATASGAAYRDRRRSCVRPFKLQDGTAMHAFVRNRLLYRYWSPQQIAAKLRVMHPEDPAQRVSHETIYAAIYAHPKCALREGMIAALRQAKSSRGRPRRTAAGRDGLNIPRDIEIKNRPEKIAQPTSPQF